jgi:hypothetical protein
VLSADFSEARRWDSGGYHAAGGLVARFPALGRREDDANDSQGQAGG